MTPLAAKNLFADPAPMSEGLTLWHRPTRRHKWRLVASDADGAKALEFDASGGHWYASFDGRDPNEE
jgi:hypothetical protein